MKIKSDSNKILLKIIIFLISFCILSSLLCLYTSATPAPENITSADELIDYSVRYSQNPAAHEEDYINIDITTGTFIDLSGTGFISIGTQDHPFKGTIQFTQSALKDFSLNVALFAYISTDARIIDTSNTDTDITITRASSGHDTHIFAENVMKGTNAASWIIKYQLDDNQYATAGLIGKIEDEAEVNISFDVSTYTDNESITYSNFYVTSSSDTAIFCSELGSEAKLNIVSFTDNGAIYTITSDSGNAGGYVGTMDAGSVLTITPGSPFETSFNITSSSKYAGGIAGEMKATTDSSYPTKIIVDTALTTNDNIVGNSRSGIVAGFAGDGCVLSFKDDFIASESASATSSNGYSGGLIGEARNAIIEIISGKKIYINSNITGSYAGGLYGLYKATQSTIVPATDPSYNLIGEYIKSGEKRKFELENLVLDVNLYTGASGGLFGVLDVDDQDIEITDSSVHVTTSNKGETLTKKVKANGSSCSGGFIGSYANSNLQRELYIHNCKIQFSTTQTANSAGYIGYAGRLGDGSPVYIKFENNCVYIHESTVGACYIYDLYSKGCFIDFCGVNTGGGSGYQAGLVYKSTKGVIRLSGITDFNGNYQNSKGNRNSNVTTYAQIIRERNSTLVYALGSGSDAGWTFNRTSNARTDDIYDWGEVLRIVHNGIAESDLFTVDMTEHTCTLKSADTEIDNLKEFILTALNIQFNTQSGTGDGAFLFSSNSADKSATLLASTINLNTDINLSGTGITGFTRDKNYDDSTDINYNAPFTGTLNGNNHTITLATGEDYGNDNNVTNCASQNRGSGILINRFHEGLFAKISDATINDLKIAGSINVIYTNTDNNANTSLKIGPICAVLSGGITLNNVEFIHNTNVYTFGNNNTKIYVGGAIGIVESTVSGKTVEINGCTFNQTYNDLRKNAISDAASGGIIARVNSTNSVTFNIDDITLGAKYNNVSYNGVTSSNVNTIHYGGLIGYIYAVTGTNIQNREINLTNINVTDNFSINSVTSSTGDVDSCGILGSVWLNTTVKIGSNSTSSDGITIGESIGANMSQTGTENDLAALVYQGTGYWRVNHINVNKLNITGSSTGSFGFIVNKTTNKNTDSALYLEVINTGSQYNIANTIFASGTGFSVFDEIAAYTYFDDTNITDNQQSVISVTTTDGNPIIMTGSGCNTYQNKTEYGKNTVKFNPNTRYYYNLESIKAKANPTDAERLLLWSVYVYGNDKDVRTKFNSFSSHPNNGNFDMEGLSYYPINSDFTLTGTNTLKFYNKEIEDGEAGTGNSDSYARSTLSQTQHYLMHTSLLYSTTSINVTNSLTLQGNTGRVNGNSGFLVLTNITSGENVGHCVINSLTLNGCYISNYDSTYSPLVINRIGSNTNTQISGVRVTASSYNSLISGNKYAGTSLIGDVGDTDGIIITGTNIRIVFSDIKLDSRKSNSGTTHLNSSYGTTRTIFSKATLLNSFMYVSNGYGEYNYTYDEDWGDGTPHNVTYGEEVKSSTEYADKENRYYKSSKYTNPSTSGNFASEFNFANGNFLPYVYDRDPEKNKHEIRVNLFDTNLVTGCGQYNDPYIIDNTDVLVTVANIINGNISDGIQIKLPIGLGNASVNNTYTDNNIMWHDANENENDEVFTYTSGNFVCSPYSYSSADVRKYLVGAYYSIESSEIELPSSFSGISNCNDNNSTNDYTFHGVIIGNGNTIVNKSASPLISVANGCVIKGLTICLNQNVSISEVDNALSYTNLSSSSPAYGAFIGRTLFGDNIFDNSYVTFGTSAKFIVASSKAKTKLYPVGGFVGCVVNGCVIFRNYTSQVNGITDDITQYVTNSAYLYFNPIIGRVINGYAFNETNSYAIESAYIKNGDKNYCLPDLNPNLAKLDVTSTQISISNPQAFYILSCIVNSFQGHGTSNTNENSLYGASSMTRYATYNEVGTSAQLTGDYASVKAYDTIGSTNVSYTILKYTTYSDSKKNVKYITNTTISEISLSSGVTYNLPKAYRGIGNGSCILKFNKITGNNATIVLNMKLLQYNYGDTITAYCPSSDAGFGLFNTLSQQSAYNPKNNVNNNKNNLIKDFTLKGSVYYDVINISSGKSIYYQYNQNIANGITNNFYYRYVGGLTGFCSTITYLKNIKLDDLEIEGPRFAGGLIGYKNNGNVYVINCESISGKSISVIAGQLAGGIIGSCTNSNLYIESDDPVTFNLSKVEVKVFFEKKTKSANNNFSEVGAGGLVGKNACTTYITNICLNGILNSNNDPIINQVSWHTETQCVSGGVVGVMGANLNVNNLVLTDILIRGGFTGGCIGNISSGVLSINGFIYNGNNNIIGSGYSSTVDKNRTPATIAGLRSVGGIVGRVATNKDNNTITIKNIEIINTSIASTYRQKTNINTGNDAFYTLYTSGNDDEKANSGDKAISGGLIGILESTVQATKCDFENIKIKNVEIFTLYDKSSNNHRSQYGPYTTGDGCVGTGGLIGSACSSITITGNNILFDTVNVNHYNYTVGTTYNSKVTGMICGNIKGTSAFKIVGISYNRDGTNNSTYIYGGKGENEGEQLYTSNENTYVVFADYNSTSALTGANSVYENTITKTNTDLDPANPYVVNNPKVIIGSSQFLTGDGMAKNTGNLAINSISSTYYSLASNYIDLFNTNYSSKFSTFGDEQGLTLTNDFVVLIADNLSKPKTTEMINSYIRSLTNTNFNYVTDTSIYKVNLYRLTYDSSTGLFAVTNNNSNLKRNNNHYYIESDNVDSGNLMFSLIDVLFYNPADTTQVAYHLYIPVLVKKMLTFNFEIATGTGTNYERYWYTQNNRFGSPLMENLGSPVTLYFKYSYLRTQDEWQGALNGGDSLLFNYPKALTFNSLSAQNIPSDTMLVLVDPSTHKTYYATFGDAYLNGVLRLSAFNTKLDGTGTNYSPIIFNDLLNITYTTNSNAGLFMEAENENVATAKAKGADGEKYFRLWTEDDGTIARYDLTVNNTDDSTLGYVEMVEPYYISFFTESSSSNVLYHCIAQSNSSLSTQEYSYPSRMQNQNSSVSSAHLYLGNIFVQEAFSVVATTDNQEMTIVNNELDVTMSATIKIKNDILSEVSTALSGNSGIEIYQSFILTLTKKTTDDHINIIEGSPDISGTYSITLATEGNIAGTSGTYGSVQENGGSAIFINGVPLNNYLVNGGVSISSDLSLVYTGDGNIQAQFPGKSNPQNTDIGVSVTGQSSMCFDPDSAATSTNITTLEDEANKLYYYREISKNAVLYYNVITNNIYGDLSNLGLNPLDSNDPLIVEIETLGVYSIGDIMVEAEGYNYIKCSIQLTCKQNSYATPLEIGEYIEKINSDTSLSTLKYEYMLDREDLTSTLLTIPIKYLVFTGADFEERTDHYYSNYMLTLTVQLSKDAGGTELLSESRATNYIIYTNARIIPEFIE